MDEISKLAFNLVGPVTIATLGFGFVGAWLLDRQRRYLLGLFAACLMFGAGVLIQLLRWPPDPAHNGLLSHLLYTSAVLCVCVGLLERSRIWPNMVLFGIIGLASMSLMWCFFYIETNLLARIYVQHFGFGIIFALTAFSLRRLIAGSLPDRILFFALAVFAIHFFPRTVLTVGTEIPPDGSSFMVFWPVLQFSMAAFGITLVLAMLLAVMSDIVGDLRGERDADGLTGLRNRRVFDEATKNAAAGTLLILCDVDHFKQINDRFGHSVGDCVLQQVARFLVQAVGRRDCTYRIGGEEFAILLAGDTRRSTLIMSQVGGNLARAVTLPDGRAIRISASFGVAERGADEAPLQWFDRADKALYDAKGQGRNRAVFATREGEKTQPDLLEPLGIALG